MILPISYKPYNNLIAFESKSKQKNSVVREAIDTSRLLDNNGYKNSEQAFYTFLVSEINELIVAKKNNNFANMEEEVGDILFDTIMLADHYQIDPEKALQKTNNKIKSRIKLAEEIAGSPLTEHSMEDRLFFWEKAKEKLRKNNR